MNSDAIESVQTHVCKYVRTDVVQARRALKTERSRWGHCSVFIRVVSLYLRWSTSTFCICEFGYTALCAAG